MKGASYDSYLKGVYCEFRYYIDGKKYYCQLKYDILNHWFDNRYSYPLFWMGI